MTIGSGYRCSNREIFNESDITVSIAMLPGNKSQLPVITNSILNKFPDGFSNKGLCREDISLVFSLIGVSSLHLLQFPENYIECLVKEGNNHNQGYIYIYIYICVFFIFLILLIFTLKSN